MILPLLRQLACYIWINTLYWLLPSTERNVLKIAMPIKLTFGRWRQEIVMVRCSEQLGNNAGSCIEGSTEVVCKSLTFVKQDSTVRDDCCNTSNHKAPSR